VFKDVYWAWDGVLDQSFCDYALSRLDWEKAIDGRIREGDGLLNEELRVTKVLWEEFTSPIAAVAFHFSHMANRLAGWNLDISFPQRVQMAKYEAGGHYNWHPDVQTPDENNLQRKVSCSILLNDASEYEGGDLEFKELEKKPPKSRGSIIVFPSTVLHRVTPVTSGVRYSAVCWTVGPPFK